MIDEDSEFGARVARRLREEVVVWLTTVTPKGAPLPSPVWFLWDGGEAVRVHSLPSARVRNLEQNPRVTLNFDGNGQGGDIVVLSGRAAVDQDAPAVAEDFVYVEKYAARIHRMGMTPETFGAKYSATLRIKLTGARGH